MGLLTGMLIAGVASQVVGGVLQHRAASKASKQQEEAGREALALQKEMYETTRGDLAPYRQQGGQGLTALTALLGLPAPTGAAAGAPPPAAPLSPQAFARSAQTALQGQAVPRTAAPQGPSQSMYGAPAPRQPGAGGLVLLRAPTGQTQAVPADQVDYYVARGATRG